MVVWTTPTHLKKHIIGITGIIYKYKWIVGIISNNQMVVSTHLKNQLVKMGSSSPKFGVKKNISNHQPVLTDGGWTNLEGVNISKIIWHCYWEGEIDPTYTFTSISSFEGWVGGWTNQPIWKILYSYISYIVKLDHFPNFFRVKKTNIFEVSPPSFNWWAERQIT